MSDSKKMPLLSESITDIVKPEDLVIDAVHDLVKDEIKRYIKEKLEENPAIKEEIKEAVGEYIEAKTKEVHATLRLVKAGGKLGLNLIPDYMRKDVSRDFIGIFEKEIMEILEKAL